MDGKKADTIGARAAATAAVVVRAVLRGPAVTVDWEALPELRVPQVGPAPREPRE
ncbi:hypothetical protein [Mycobacterium persicum]|uniref:hypothetical protein n=1 Tax=Mycobacterium persicum TaxID=1487726 RepID=UPI000AA3222D|nr:hypothetical protein [Mycobacterium persicum]